MTREYTMESAKRIAGRYGFKFTENVISARDAKDTSNRASAAVDFLIRFHGMVLGK